MSEGTPPPKPAKGEITTEFIENTLKGSKGPRHNTFWAQYTSGEDLDVLDTTVKAKRMAQKQLFGHVEASAKLKLVWEEYKQEEVLAKLRGEPTPPYPKWCAGCNVYHIRGE
mmetsp:Transcript_17876/g.19905  ORF Transcript_17876/g.19905 Transcript_17876/m.19905 type:complete len:112 (+) Transcript_17876:20-355(+)